MIKFIEEKVTKDNKIVGIPYNTDSYTDSHGDKKNYRFYFDDNQSINIIYQKRLFFISDKERVSIEILDTPPTKNTVFFLFDFKERALKFGTYFNFSIASKTFCFVSSLPLST